MQKPREHKREISYCFEGDLRHVVDFVPPTVCELLKVGWGLTHSGSTEERHIECLA